MKQYSPYLLVFLFGVLIYANTVPNRYAYDDYSVVGQNTFTRQGMSGIPGHLLNDSFYGFTGQKNLFRGGRYRPLSLITFCVEYALFGENPHVSHLVNILLFGLLCVVLLKVLSTLFRDKLVFSGFRDYFLSLSLMAALVFACHPIHTEVVANIKGRDELMALLFSLIAWNASLKYSATLKIRQGVFAAVWFFLALMSKESAAPFLLMIPLSVYCFRSGKTFRQSVAGLSVSLLSAFLLFMLIRQSVIGWGAKPSMPDNILSNAFMYAKGFSERYGTTFYTLGLYLKLLLFPHPLTIDYYPFYITYTGLASLKALLPALAYLALAACAVWFTYRKNAAGFGLLFYLVTLFPVSNLLFAVGPFMGERFAFIPSLGFILALTWLILKGAEKTGWNRAVPLVFGVILTLFTIKTVSRNFDWRDNFTLYNKDVKTSVNSAIISRAAGQEILNMLETEKDSARYREWVRTAITYLEQAEKLSKSETETLLLGNAYFDNSEYEKALNMYAETLKMNKDYAKAYGNYMLAVNKLSSPQAMIRYCDRLIAIAGARYEPFYTKGVVYGKLLNSPDSSLVNLIRAIGFDSSKVECLSSLGVAYAMKGDLRKSAFFLEKGYKINPGDKSIVNNLIVTWLNLGEKERAQALINSQQAQH